jgi:hypothetical protein
MQVVGDFSEETAVDLDRLGRNEDGRSTMTLKTKLMTIGVAVVLTACTAAPVPPVAVAPPERPAVAAVAGETEAPATVEQPDCRVSSPPLAAC